MTPTPRGQKKKEGNFSAFFFRFGGWSAGLPWASPGFPGGPGEPMGGPGDPRGS